MTAEAFYRPEEEPVDTNPLLVSVAEERHAKELDEQAPPTDQLRYYLNRIGRVALLTAAEEVELSKRMEVGAYASALYATVDPELSKEEQHENLETLKEEFRHNSGLGDEASESEIEAYADSVRARTATPQQRRDLQQLIREGENARQHMVAANLRLVISISKRYVGKGLPHADLIQEGNLGLIRAVSKFDYKKGFKFSTYATWWIRQAITRGMADTMRTVRLPVHVTEESNKMHRIRRDLYNVFQEEPSDERLAQEMNTTPGRIAELKDWFRPPVSLDMPVGKDESDGQSLGGILQDMSEFDATEAVHAATLHDTLLEAIASLKHSDRDKQIFKLRNGLVDGTEYSASSLAERFGVSRERIRHINIRIGESLARNPRLRALMD